jgi:hypothetical protein
MDTVFFHQGDLKIYIKAINITKTLHLQLRQGG